MTIDVKDVKRFWLVPVGIGSDRELVLEIGKGKRFQYKKTYESERFYNYLRGLSDFVEFGSKYIRKSIIKKIELQGDLATPSILIDIYGYRNPLKIGANLRVSHSDIGMIDTFHFLKRLFKH